MTVTVHCGNPTCAVTATVEPDGRTERETRGDLVRALVKLGGWRPDPQANSIVCHRCAEDL
jgi:hypothetical protein